MRLYTRIKAMIIIVFMMLTMLIFSGIDFVDKEQVNGNNKSILLTNDNYEKYSGEKILLNSQKTNIKGLFGELEIMPFILEPSSDFVVNQTNYDDIIEEFKSSDHWSFKNSTLKEIRALFVSAGIDSTTCDELIKNTFQIKNNGEYVTTPSDSFFWGLSSKVKGKLYPLIGKNDENVMYSQPLYFYSDDAKEWLYKSSLNEEVKERILSLVYKRNGICYLADPHLILPYLKSFDERIEFLKVVYRSKSMDAKLIIKHGQDVSDMVKYWGALGRASYIETILKDLSNRIGGGKISVKSLLPTIPQSRLNTFCGSDEFNIDWKDCHWTTINFFNNKIDERYYDLPDIFSYIKEISSQLKNDSQLKFGDIICVFDKNNQLVHSCTYIADNLTLTKNGMGNLNPFVLSKLDKTISIYGEKAVYLSRTIADTYLVK